jgi:hypothetical protein
MYCAAAGAAHPPALFAWRVAAVWDVRSSKGAVWDVRSSKGAVSDVKSSERAVRDVRSSISAALCRQSALAMSLQLQRHCRQRTTSHHS